MRPVDDQDHPFLIKQALEILQCLPQPLRQTVLEFHAVAFLQRCETIHRKQFAKVLGQLHSLYVCWSISPHWCRLSVTEAECIDWKWYFNKLDKDAQKSKLLPSLQRGSFALQQKKSYHASSKGIKCDKAYRYSKSREWIRNLLDVFPSCRCKYCTGCYRGNTKAKNKQKGRRKQTALDRCFEYDSVEPISFIGPSDFIGEADIIGETDILGESDESGQADIIRDSVDV